METLVRILLYPFSILYDLFTWLRNLSYDSGSKMSIRFEVPVISVGNLRVGGTGKTPHVAYLLDFLQDRLHTAMLSRGYKRKTKGFRIATPEDSALTLGDEPMELLRHFGEKVVIAVGEDRITAIPSILLERPQVNLIVLDDAYQHRPVQPHLNILLTEFHRPFYHDLVLPAGRLRESRRGAKRADCLIFTKCPEDLPPQAMEEARQKAVRWLRPDTPIFFTGIQYGKPIPLADGPAFNPNQRVLLVTGIANPSPLKQSLQRQYALADHLTFSDHQDYSPKVLATILEAYHQLPDPEKCIMTTEKDAVKWLPPQVSHLLKGIPVFYLPIQIFFHADEEAFQMLVMQKVSNPTATSL